MTTYELPLKIGEALIESGVRTLKQINQSQEMGEKFARGLVHQGRLVRETSQKAAQNWADASRENNKQVQQLVHSTVRLSIDSYCSAQQNVINELTQQVERLSKQVEMLMQKSSD